MASESASELWVGDDAGGFSHGGSHGSSEARDSAAGNLDGDGSLDVFVVSSAGDHRTRMQN